MPHGEGQPIALKTKKGKEIDMVGQGEISKLGVEKSKDKKSGLEGGKK